MSLSTTTTSYSFRILDFDVVNESELDDGGEEEDTGPPKDNSEFVVRMFAVDERGTTYCVRVEGYHPFFYVMVGDHWDLPMKNRFVEHIRTKVGKFYRDSIVKSTLVKRRKLYGFDGGKKHTFVMLEFANTNVMRRASNLWYSSYEDGHTLLKEGLHFAGTKTRLYEANIPPLLRLFHIRDLSPSGWVELSRQHATSRANSSSCEINLACHYKHLVPQNHKETRVPYKIMSFDIEASSSHGDFPLPIKTYKKLATNIVEHLEKRPDMASWSSTQFQEELTCMVQAAFGVGPSVADIDLVFPKEKARQPIATLCEQWLRTPLQRLKSSASGDSFQEAHRLEVLFDKICKELHQQPKKNDIGGDEDSDHDADNEDDDNDSDDGEGLSMTVVEEASPSGKRHRPGESGFLSVAATRSITVVELLADMSIDRTTRINELNASLNAVFPKLEGDKVTFIGSTFMNYANKEPHFNHCIALNSCAPVDHATIETYATEREVLLAWRDLVQRENPDIIIGYNIFGFDYEFLFRRAEETDCVQEFLKLSRNAGEVCGTLDRETNKYKIEESTIQIASGQHDLKFIKMNGRLQVDLYNFYRREVNLVSYKLDYVAGHFIGDYVKGMEPAADVEEQTVVLTSNLTGLLAGSYVHFEEIGHSTEYYQQGAKFLVQWVDPARKAFGIRSPDVVQPDFSKKVRWCLAKDDVTPKDIFRMTNGTDADRAVIAKYCLQDCNLVHYLFNKSDILTGFIEMAKLCSVPINFLVMRGQGIKLFSFISKKCREKNTLMPVIDKGDADDGYEGAIVLDPKCDLYLDNPVACVDYASLYPSSMISENLSHDSKVWTREYDLAGNLMEETGEKDPTGTHFLYDNLPGFEYIDIRYDTYRYVRKAVNKKAEKVVVGYKQCRFAVQRGQDAIMPSVLKELLKARKDTRKLIPQQTDEFMKQVLDQRQLSCKVTANSLYGQCGAKTSAFYEKDIAACTTATGRKLLTYAKRVIEECYGDRLCPTEHHGVVRTRAEYIYGDTDSVFFTFNLETPEGTPIRGKEALAITIELAQQAGHLASTFLKGPHDLEYEKTFMPFCLLSKKRYVGMLYETDPAKGKRKEMGIVLKRRDNAPIVKDVYGGIIDILMKKQDIGAAVAFLQQSLQDIVDEQCPMEKLIITKSLRSGYKNPQSIAHKVLADRIAARDPGNKPGPGDRIPFVYIHNPNKKALQGEKIETPSFVLENHLKIDYAFYITNQIMKPVQQVFSLVLQRMWEMNPTTAAGKLAGYNRAVEKYRSMTEDTKKLDKKLEQLRCAEVKKLLFDQYLRETTNAKMGLQSVTSFFAPAPASSTPKRALTTGSGSPLVSVGSSSPFTAVGSGSPFTAVGSSSPLAPAPVRKTKVKLLTKQSAKN